jgi:hypothetical protein
MLTKRGAPQKVDEAFISHVNEFGISPLTSERRLNLRTISARTKERLEKKVDEQHGWSLLQRQEEVHDLAKKLEDERCDHLLEKKAITLRAKFQKKMAQEHATQGGGCSRQTTEAPCSGRTQCERFATAGTDGNI